jgi:WD40 repeat protein
MPKCALLATAETDAAAGARLLSARESDWSRTLRVIETGDTDNLVAFSPDDTQIISASQHDRAVRLWNARTGDPLAILHGHMLSVLCVAFSPDGAYIVSGSLDSTVRLWDARTYRQCAVLYAHSQITDYQAMRDVHSWSSHTHAVHCVAFSPAGSVIAYGFASGDCGLRLWDSVTGTQVFLPVGQDIQVTTVAFSPDGSKLVSGSMHGVVYVWDVQTRTQVAALQGHSGMIRSVSFSPDGARLVSGANDVTIRVWNMRTHKSACLLEGHSNVVKSVAYSSDGRHIVSGSWDGTIRVWDAQSTKQLVMFHGHHPIVNCVAVSSSDERLVSAGMDSSIRIWDMRTRSQSTANECGSNRTDNLVLSRDGALLVSTTDNYGKIWDMQTYKHIATLEGHTSQISVAAFSYDGTRVVSGSYDRIVRVWDARIGQQLAVFEGHEKGVSAVAFSPDGLRVVSGSYDESVRLWEMRTSTQIAVFHPAMSSQAFDTTIPTAPDTLDESKSASQDDRASHVALSSKGIQVGKVYPTALHGGPVAPLSSDLTIGQLVSSREPHTEVSAVASSPEGLHVISASFDGSIRVWDVMRATQIALLEEHSSPVTSIEFSFDGSWLRSFDLGGKELAWDFQHIVTTQQRVSSPREVNCAAPVTTSLTDDSMPVRRNGLAHVLESADYPLGASWLYCTAGPDSKTLLPLCWLPIERRGRALFRGYIAIVVGMGGNVIVLDFTDTIERLQSLGIL